jgi:hypothetical protein
MKGRIKYGLGRTINMGNYENAKIEVGLELDVETADRDALDGWFEKARKWVNNKVKQEEMEWRT